MERVFIFIDGSNFYHGLKENIGITNIDFLKFVFKLCEQRKFIGANYYNAPLKKEYTPQEYKEQQKFFNYIQKLLGFTLKLGHLELRNINFLKGIGLLENKEINKKEKFKEVKIYVEKGVDILLATDMLSFAYDNIYDTGILISGDGDFAYVIKKIKLLNKKIEVAYFPKRRCWHLKQVSDRFIPLEKDFFNDLIYEK